MKPTILIALILVLSCFSSLGNAESISPKNQSLYSDKIHSLYSDGKEYRERGMFKEALKAYGRILGLSLAVDDEANYAGAASIIGLVYLQMKEYQKAIKYYEIYKAFNIKIGNESSLAFTLTMIGSSYFHLKKYSKAIESDKKALVIYKRLGNESQIASTHHDIGQNLYRMNQEEKALENFEKALVIYRRLGEDEGIARVLSFKGSIYSNLHKYNQAEIAHTQALALFIKLNIKEDIALTLTGLGSLHSTKGDNEKAIAYYEEAFEIYMSLKDHHGSIYARSLIAGVYGELGQYDKQIEIYKMAINYHKKSGEEYWLMFDYHSIGHVYSRWTKDDLALKYFQQALNLSKKYEDKEMQSDIYIALGYSYIHLGQLDKGLENLKKSLKFYQKMGDEVGIANSLKGIAGVQSFKEEYGQAVKTLKRALKIFSEIGNVSGIAVTLLEISDAYARMHKYDKAWEYANQTIEISKDLQNPNILRAINQLVAQLYIIEGNYEQAIKYFSKAIKTVEKFRKTATGKIRRDFLEDKIFLYKYLALSYLREGKFSTSFLILEQSRSRLLLDKLLIESKKIEIPKVSQIQDQMDVDTAILAFGRLDPIQTTNEILLEYAITRDNYEGYIANTSILLPSNEGIGNDILKWKKNQRRIKLINLSGKENSTNYLENLVGYYRFLLANPSSENDSALREMGRALYDLLIKPLLPIIRGKKNLLIIPDGILSFVPFEALIDEKGNYLIEEFNISYVQSMAVANLLRDRRYEEDQKPMLAFGGAIYNPNLKNQKIIEADIQLSALTVNTLQSLSQNDTRSTSEALAKLGYGSWSNLPGTKKEVEAINKIVANSEMLLGADVNEAAIKEMSANGELSKYKVLHFATHGLTVPEFPELSSIVLSQFDNEEKIEDGYLRMEEISKLKLKAEFVNLSACQTGLGRLYAGEGVVGLTYAFLLAGANGLSVSLWNVEDESTAKFMTGLYKLVKEKGITFSQGISEMKRSFIRGQVSTDTFDPGKSAQIINDSKNSPNKLSHPFYWAPFVYYGKN